MINENFEIARENLTRLANWYSENASTRNEATARLQLIDTLFFDCLGWSKHDVILEESVQGEFADYTFLNPRRILILEAKKEGEYFEAPITFDRVEYSLVTLTRDNPHLLHAARQVAGYSQERGVPLAAVSNGHQLLAFIANRIDGTPPLEGRCIFFPSLEHMKEHFIEIWNALSKDALSEGRLSRRLLGDRSIQLPPKLAASLPTYPGLKQRNVFQTDLQIVSELILEDITRSRELEPTFLVECYCQSGALSQYSLVSKAILKARYDALFDAASPGPTTIPAVNREGISPELLAESLSRRPILIIGDVGVGKTTFIRYLLTVDAAPLFADAISIYIDLGSQATLSRDIRDFILDEIAEQLRENASIDIQERIFVRAVYHSDLERFARGLYSDLRTSNPQSFDQKEIEFLQEKLSNKEGHLRRAIEHIVRGRKKQVVIFIDNADQRSDDTQQATFLVSQELADHWPITVFVTLRPETFYRSQRAGTLSGYHPKAFTIAPPRIDQVLAKRLQFALRITSGQLSIHSLANVHLQLESLETIIRAFLESIDRSGDLVEFLDNIAAGNVRLALDIVRSFFGSGHIDTQKIIEIYRDQGSYYVPLHEFIRAVLFGDSEYYDPSRSPLANLFDIAYVDPKEHFLVPTLVAYLGGASTSGTASGFIDVNKLYDHAQSLGFTPEQVDAAIVRANRHKLIESAARRQIGMDGQFPSAFRATTAGMYHVTRLCRMFSYIDAIIVDTPILDVQSRSVLTDTYTIDNRLDRAEQFLTYLDTQWIDLDKKGSLFDWPAISEDVYADILRIRDRATRNRLLSSKE